MDAYVQDRCDSFVQVKTATLTNTGFQSGRTKEESWRNVLVEEMMIAANETAAKYGDNYLIRMIFQTQRGISAEDYAELQEFPQGLPLDHHARRFWTPARRQLVAGAHTNLGVAKYAQVTSPIRRAFDSVNTLQLKSSESVGESTYLYSRSELQ